MNNTRSTIGRLFTAILAIALLGTLLQPVIGTQAKAGDLTYSTFAVQTGDSDLVIKNKQAVAAVNLAKGDTASNITATGTTSLTSTKVFSSLIVNKAGSADSEVVIYDGTTAFATVSTAAQTALRYDIAITTGTLKLINTGTTSADITVGRR